MIKEAKAALTAAEKYKPKPGTEEHHHDFIVGSLRDVVTRIEILPDLLHTEKVAQDVEDARVAYRNAQAAQRG